MTESEESHSNTRPISVAELLAKNGTIGAPPVGGRRRRRRGNTDAVTVAELTGEIPIVTDDAHGDAHDEAHDEAHDQTVAVADEREVDPGQARADDFIKSDLIRSRPYPAGVDGGWPE